MSTSQNIYAIKDRAPEFPCWLWSSHSQSWWRREANPDAAPAGDYTHWSPDAPEAPKATPSLPASPELPESVRQAVQSALDKFGIEDGSRRLHAECVAEVLAALAPLWPSAPVKDARVCYADGDKCHGCDHYHGKADKCRYHPDRPTPSPVAGLPTPETDATEFETTGPNGAPFKVVCSTKARSLERRLAAARAEVEREHAEVIRWMAQASEWCHTHKAEKATLEAQLATAKEEVEGRDMEQASMADFVNTHAREVGTKEAPDACWACIKGAVDNIVFHQREQVIRLEYDLAKANAAVEEAKSNERVLRARLDDLAREGESYRAQLAAQQSVPPEARAVEAATRYIDATTRPGGSREATIEFLASIIQRVCFPPGEGEEGAEWATAAAKDYANRVAPLGSDAGDWERIVASLPIIILKHAPRPTAARECGASEAVRKAAEELHEAFIRVKTNFFASHTTADTVAILTKHGLGVSEDTARLDWIVKNGYALTYDDKSGIGARINLSKGDVRAAIDAAMQQGGKTP